MTEEVRIDAVPILAKLSGQTEEELLARVQSIREQMKRTDACGLHELDLVEEKPMPKWRCKSCGWVPLPGEVARYEQGLAHGRAHATGGGR